MTMLLRAGRRVETHSRIAGYAIRQHKRPGNGLGEENGLIDRAVLLAGAAFPEPLCAYPIPVSRAGVLAAHTVKFQLKCLKCTYAYFYLCKRYVFGS